MHRTKIRFKTPAVYNFSVSLEKQASFPRPKFLPPQSLSILYEGIVLQTCLDETHCIFKGQVGKR